MTNTIKWVLTSDIHLPLHDPRMLDLLFQVIKKWKPDAIDLVGDIDNADGTSRWLADSVGEVNNPIVQDAQVLRQFSAELRESAPNADIHWHDGNHGWTRHDNYIKTKAKALDGLVTPDMLYDLNKHGFEWHLYQDPPVKRFGNIHVHHGKAISKWGGQSVKADVEDWNVSLIRGHSHRQATYRKSVCFSDETKRMTQDLEGYEIGHLMDLSKARYEPTHNWQAGFCIAHVYQDRPHVQLVPIHLQDEGYVCFVDGTKFVA